MAKHSNNMNAFTRGSQICLHALRMMAQGTKASLVTGITFSLVWLFWRSYRLIEFKDLYYWIWDLWASLKIEVGGIFYPVQDLSVSIYSLETKIRHTVSALYYKKCFLSSASSMRLDALCVWAEKHALGESVIVFSLSILCTYVFFVLRGKKSMVKKKTRGSEIVSPSELKAQLRKHQKASDLSFNSLPLVKESERQHVLITGTTGTGKTNMIHELLPQIRKRGEKAIIVDLNGSFVGPYFEEGQDYLLNPFDRRSIEWTPWGDCQEKYDYDALSHALVGESNSHDPFWQDTAVQVLSVALEQFQRSGSIKELLYLLNSASMAMYEQFFKDSSVASLTSQDADRTVASIRANINNKTKPLEYLTETSTPFSLKKYVLDKDDRWLFITAMPETRETLKPLLTGWLGIILQGIMQKEIIGDVANTWLIIDELPALGKISSLKTALAEARKYGGCIVAGVQNIHQLMSIYGRNEAMNLLDQFNSRFIYRVGDQETAAIASKMLGEQESIETQESLSYGANTMRDGVNINHIERRKQLVLGTEVMNLHNLECYAKLAGNWPITKLSMKYQERKPKNKVFMKKEEK